jgi:hypothetical protein
MAIPDEEKRLSPAYAAFVEKMVRYRDVAKAADACKITYAAGERIYNIKAVQRAIERRRELIDRESARLTAKAVGIEVTMLDHELLRLIKSDAHSKVKLEAIVTGYKRVGMIKENEFLVPNGAPVEGDGAPPQPQMYQGLRSTVRRTVTEEIQHTQESIASVPDVLEY